MVAAPLLADCEEDGGQTPQPRNRGNARAAPTDRPAGSGLHIVYAKRSKGLIFQQITPVQNSAFPQFSTTAVKKFSSAFLAPCHMDDIMRRHPQSMWGCVHQLGLEGYQVKAGTGKSDG